MSMTLKFIILQANYFALFCSAFVFSNPILSFRGFNINNIGYILTLSSILSIILQPILGKLISDIKEITNKRVLLTFLIIMLVSTILSYRAENKFIIEILYIIIITSVLTSQTFIYTFVFDYINSGVNVNFGLARGLGSLAFAITSLLVGYFAKIYGYSFIQYLNIALIFVIILSILSFNSDLIKKTENKKKIKSLTFIQFSKKYKKFTFLLFGLCLILTTHIGISSFLIDIAKTVSKGSFFVGLSFFIAALLELPIMGLFNKLNKDFGEYKLFYISVIAFTVKVFVMFVGLVFRLPSIILIAQFIQILGFALYLPASLYYLNKIIDFEDTIKAQSYLGVATTLGNVISSFIGSKIIYYFNTTYMLAVFLIISLIGTIIVIKNLERRKYE